MILSHHNPLLLIDYYKATHSMMYPEDITKLVSYLTPRSSRIEDQYLMNFGLTGFVKEFLVESFNHGFFDKDEDELVEEYKRILDNTLGSRMYDIEKVRALHRLGYLPLRICEIPEGIRVPMHVPMLSIENTHPDFAWLVNTIESVLSAYFWHTAVSAEVGFLYRQITEEVVKKTCDSSVSPMTLLSDFSFRGQESPESAIRSSAGWLCSHLYSATVPAIIWLEDYYNSNSSEEDVGYGATSTEHSVMCSNYAVDGNEKEFIRRLLTQIYPKGYFVCVCDSYDYWNVVDNILPELKTEILSRSGCIGIRGDSGDPVEIVTETVKHLWDIFGGHINTAGYKVLNSHVKAVYGDSITLERAKRIYDILEKEGFAANNVALGVGSFSFQCIEENGVLKPFTRDTFGIAVKSTYAVVDGKEQMIYKDPKTDTGLKKSQKGLVLVYKDEEDDLKYIDHLLADSYKEKEKELGNAMICIYENGEVKHDFSLKEIRENVNKEIIHYNK